jgi:hypothetical protein
MKKSILALGVAVLPVVASAQVQLIAGWNFGQFLPSPTPILDGASFETVGSIPSNWTSAVQAGPEDTGQFKQDNSLSTIFSAGSGVLSFDGGNSSSAWGANASVNIGTGLDAVNAATVTGNPMYTGDDAFLSLRLTAVSGVTDIALTLNTVGFGDFDPAAFGQDNDANFTVAAYNASGASATIEWLFDGSVIATSVANAGAGNFQAFSVDLPEAFYGDSDALLIARITGDVVIDHIQFNAIPVAAIPEPSTYAAIVAVAGLAVAAGRRRRSA